MPYRVVLGTVWNRDGNLLIRPHEIDFVTDLGLRQQSSPVLEELFSCALSYVVLDCGAGARLEEVFQAPAVETRDVYAVFDNQRALLSLNKDPEIDRCDILIPRVLWRVSVECKLEARQFLCVLFSHC